MKYLRNVVNIPISLRVNYSNIGETQKWDTSVSSGKLGNSLVEDNQEELFLDSLDKILAQCVEKQIENLQAKERSVGLSTEEKRELQDLILKGLKA